MCNVFLRQSHHNQNLSSCNIILLTIQNQPVVQEKTIEDRDTSPPHSSNFIQDWISKLCCWFVFFFCPVEAPLEDSYIFLKWLITYFGWMFSLPSSHVSCIQTQDKSSAGRPALFRLSRALFLVLDSSAVVWLLHVLSKFPWATRIFDFLTYFWKAWLCAEKLILPV